MPEDAETPPSEQPKGKGGFALNKKIGPFPGYVWLGIVGVPVVAFVLTRKKTPSVSGIGSAIPNSDINPQVNPGATGTSGGGGSSAPFDLSPILTAMQGSSAAEIAAIQSTAQANQQASAGLMTTLGSLMQSITNMRATPTAPSAPPYAASAPAYQVPTITNTAMYHPPLPASLPIPTYNPVAPQGYGIYNPGGGFQPITPAPGYERTTYFGGNGQVIYGGVPA